MNNLIVIGLFVAVTCCTAAPTTTTAAPCSTNALNAELLQCVRDNGLSWFYIKGMSNMLTAQDYKDQCANPDPYRQTGRCASDAIKRCGDDLFLILNSFDQLFESGLAFCNDSKINFECLANMTRQQSEIKSCVNAHLTTGNVTSLTVNDIPCLTYTIGTPCAVALMRTCDDHTATVLQYTMAMNTPLECYPAIVG